jgi:hypothetical protein
LETLLSTATCPLELQRERRDFRRWEFDAGLTALPDSGPGKRGSHVRDSATLQPPVGAISAIAFWCVSLAFAFPAFCADDGPLHATIDRLIAGGAPDYSAIAAPLAPDAEFLRRVSLDLNGMPPTAAEARAFFNDPDPQKREKLIDRLLERDEYARHMQNVFDAVLMLRLPANNVKAEEWQAFLRESFAANKPWDQLVREILAADGADPKARGPARFYLDREAEINHVTRDIGSIFLGTDLQCAQCHDHPMIASYKQRDYYGIAAFLVRSSLFEDKKVQVLTEKADGEVSFESVFEVRDKISKGPQSTPPQLFGQFTVEEPKIPKDEAYLVKPTRTVRGVPKFSRRLKLAEAVTSSSNRRFARTAANRLWSIVMGRGIVEPVQFDHPDNPPSHPELLEKLTDEFVAHGFDIKWMLRELVLSQTYQRASLPDDGEGSTPPAEEHLFARAKLRPLLPTQFAWAVLQASGAADIERAALGEKATEEAVHAKLAGRLEGSFVSLFGGAPGMPVEHFESTVTQVLFLSNSTGFLGLIQRKDGNLADRLLKLPEAEVGQIADELYLSALTRHPSPEDVEDVAAFLNGSTGEARVAAMEDLIWSVLVSSEFRFNH